MANEQAKATIYLDGKQAEAALDGLKTRAKSLREELKRAQDAGDLIKTKKLQSEIKGVEAAQRSLRKETYDYEKVLRNINGASMSELKKALRTVEVQLNKMSRTDPGYATKAAQAKLLRTEINRVNTSLRAQPAFMSRAAEGFNKYFSIVTAGIATITGIIFSAKEFIKGMVGLDDALADVMKTTGMARNEVREMYQDFKTFNTRTPRRELLELAEEAGRLGKKSKQDVMDFVEVANQIKVALGDDLGGEAGVAIREVGKLTEIYKIGEQYGTGFKESMLKVGSAINEVSANSNAQAPYLIDYLKRMGGIAGQMKVNAAQVVGYAASLDQLGQSQEMAATAQGKLMVDMFKDHAKYATVAKMSTKDFSTLLKTDANEAFLKLLEGLNGNNEGFSVMAEKLDGMGVDGARAVQVLSVLSANTKMVREQQDLANKAMNEGISLTNEYNIKNNNLAGSVEKIGQFLRSKFINSSFLGWMENVVAKVSEWTKVKLSDTLREQQTEVNGLVIQLRDANLEEDRRAEILKKLEGLAPTLTKNIKDEQTSIEALTDAVAAYNSEMAMKILIAQGDEEIAAQKAKVNSFKQLSLQAEATLAQQMRNSLSWFEKKAPDVKKTAENILYDTQKSLIQKAEELNRLALDNTTLGNAGLFNALDSYRIFKKNYGDNLNSLNILVTKTATLKDEWKNIFGITGENPPSAPSPPPAGSDGGTGSGGSGLSGSQGLGSPAAKSGWESILAPAKENPIKTDWMDAQMQADMELFAEKKRSEEEWTEFLKKQTEERMDALQEELQQDQENFEFEKQLTEARKQLKGEYMNAIGQVAGALASMFKEGSAAQIAAIAVEKSAAIAQVIFQTAVANAKAVAMSPLTAGQPWVTINSISAGASIAAIIGTTISQFKDKKNNDKPGYASGKYPALQTGMYGDKPHYALFNEVPGLPEMVVDGLTTKRLQVNHPQIVKAIYNVRDGKEPGYADGKYPSTSFNSPPEGVVAAGRGGGSSDLAQNKILSELAAELRELRKWRPAISVEKFEKQKVTYDKIIKNTDM